MCGIFALSKVEEKTVDKKVPEHTLKGLKSLDYRGYDSWGIVWLIDKKLKVKKAVGQVPDSKSISFSMSEVALAHTRWATHGSVTKNNAHPHLAEDKSFGVVHNGIVENYSQLQVELIKKGYNFSTQTDTEVIVRLVEHELSKLKPAKLGKLRSDSNQDLLNAIRQAFLQLEGRNTIGVLNIDGTLIGARNGSPLVVGLAGQGTVYLSSDVLSFSDFVESMVVLDNGQLVMVELGNKPKYLRIKDGAKFSPKIEPVSIDFRHTDLQGYDHYMLKEIEETPTVIQRLVTARLDSLQPLAKLILRADQVYTIGSGTAALAAAQVAYYLRTYTKVRAISLIGAETSSFEALIQKNDLILALSQSGETADVLEVLERLKKRGVQLASYVNMPGSMMTRISDLAFMSQAGPEYCVMSTKVFTDQFVWGYLLAKMAVGQSEEALKKLQVSGLKMGKYLKTESNHKEIKRLADKLIKHKSIFILAKGQLLEIAKEGMVKIIEGTYLHAHAIPAGDLKHYAITLIEKEVPVIVLFSEDEHLNDIFSAVNEVKARGATVIGIGPKLLNKKQDAIERLSIFDHLVEIPQEDELDAVFAGVTIQLLAYYMTVSLGNPVDKPRNIAKSVTVK